MRRVVVTPDGVNVVNVDRPEPGPGEVLVRTVVAGICGSDIHAVHGRHPFIQLPYAVMRPGPISNVLGTTTHSDGSSADLIVINGHESFPTTGSLDFTTVRINGGPGYPVNVWSVVGAWAVARSVPAGTSTSAAFV